MILSVPILLTMRSNAAPVPNGAVVIRRGIMLAAGPADKIIKQYPGHRVLRMENTVLMPGLVNLHTHLELPPLLDTIRSTTFTDWALNLIKTKKGLSNNDYAAAVRINIHTLINTGTTTVGEICTHGISPAYLRQSGLRAILFHEIISMNPFLKFRGLKHAAASARTIQTGLSPHAPHTVSEEVLIEINKLAVRKRVPLSMHIAESKDEIRLLQRKKSGLEKLYQFANWELAWAPTGLSSFEYLNRIGFLSPHLLAVHAVQTSDNDIRLIKKSKTSIAHCPRSNKELGVGRMPLKKYLDEGIPVGLGTDSLASTPSLNLWDEMRYAYKVHRRSGVTPRDIFHMATLGGASALGMDREIGSIEPGKKADCIAVPLPKKDTGDLYSDLLRETNTCIMSMVNGHVVYRGDAGRKT